LKVRFERVGIRSGQEQVRILKKLVGDGWVRVSELSKGRGRPQKLVEGTQHAFRTFGVEWPRQGRGELKTRAATASLQDKLSKQPNVEAVVPEGVVGRDVDGVGKQVDLLVRFCDGGVAGVEVAGASAKHEATNALWNVRAGVRRHVVVCTDQRVADDVRKALAKHEELQDDRVEVVTLARALGEDWTL
jgi:hypothetical protein